MPQTLYRIRRSFLIPLALDALLLFVLLLLACLYRGSSIERAVLAVLTLVVFFVLIEAARRFIAVGDTDLRIHKFFKTKTLAWSDITHIGCMAIRSRVYILLTTKKGFYIVSNAYDRFSQLIRELIAHLPSEGIEVEAEAKAQIDHPTRNVSDLVAAWFAAAVLVGIVFFKITS